MRRWLEPMFHVTLVLAIAAVALSIRSTPTPGPGATTAVATPGGTSLSPTPTWRPTPAGPSTPSLSGDNTPAPTSTARSGVGSPARFFRGQASYWDSLGSGWYVAVRPDLGIRVGSIVQVCDARAQHCRAAPVVTTCGCFGPHSGRIVDLSLDLFRLYRNPLYGVVQVVLEVVP